MYVSIIHAFLSRHVSQIGQWPPMGWAHHWTWSHWHWSSCIDIDPQWPSNFMWVSCSQFNKGVLGWYMKIWYDFPILYSSILGFVIKYLLGFNFEREFPAILIVFTVSLWVWMLRIITRLYLTTKWCCVRSCRHKIVANWWSDDRHWNVHAWNW